MTVIKRSPGHVVPAMFHLFAKSAYAAIALVASTGAAHAAPMELVCNVTATASASNLDRGPQEERVGDWVFFLDADKEQLSWKSGAQLRSGGVSDAPLTVSDLDITPDAISFCAWPGGCNRDVVTDSGGTTRASVLAIDRTSGALSMAVQENHSYMSLQFGYHGTCNKAPPKPKPKF
ncbi:hypothetical protein [Lysobacter sp. HA18]